MKWILAVATFLYACVASAATSSVVAENVWSRATPPGSTVGVVYADVVAKHADELLSATTEIADRVEVHTSVNEAGTMKMRRLMSIPLPANKIVKFAPNGMHFMLLGLREPLKAGTTIRMTLQFRTSAPLAIQAKVIGPGDREPD